MLGNHIFIVTSLTFFIILAIDNVRMGAKLEELESELNILSKIYQETERKIFNLTKGKH